MVADRKVRVWVGTRKGGYVAESDARRRRWTVKGPFQEGQEVYHIVPDPRHPGTVYLAANSGWWGPLLKRSRDGGKKWTEVSVPGTPRFKQRTPPIEAPSAAFPIKNLWHITPGPPGEPRTVFMGVDPASLWRSDDEGQSWAPLPGLNDHPTRPQWNPGAGGMCLHTILVDPENPRRMYVGISAAGTFRTEDGGDHWTAVNRGVRADFLPNKLPEVGQCVHKVAMDPADPATLYRQDHCGIYVSHDRAENWKRVGKRLPDDFGMVVASAPALPGNAFFVPEHGLARLIPGGQVQIQRWSEKGRNFTPLVKGNPWPGDYGTHREGLATDALDPAGIYLGTTTGQLFWSATGGTKWEKMPYQFPAIHSVEVSGPRAAP
jgi:photosystem II stability/assembly factor-like uncharacterized protein